ncbi:hypothetical protein H1R20_g4643, partial [Candolleomyces eurysporus]
MTKLKLFCHDTDPVWKSYGPAIFDRLITHASNLRELEWRPNVDISSVKQCRYLHCLTYLHLSIFEPDADVCTNPEYETGYRHIPVLDNLAGCTALRCLIIVIEVGGVDRECLLDAKIVGKALFFDFGRLIQPLARSKDTLETLHVDKWLIIDCERDGGIPDLAEAFPRLSSMTFPDGSCINRTTMQNQDAISAGMSRLDKWYLKNGIPAFAFRN